MPDWKGCRCIWKDHVPKLCICHKSEDMCPECLILKIKFKYLGSRKPHPDDVDDPDAAVTTDPFINDDENILFNGNTHAEQVKQHHNVAHEWRQIANQVCAMNMRTGCLFFALLLSFLFHFY